MVHKILGGKIMKHIIKYLVSVLCTVMMVGILAVAAETPSENGGLKSEHLRRDGYQTLYVKTNGGNLNVGSGAGTEYKIVGKLANGTEILGWSYVGKIDSEGRGWTDIRAIGIDGEEVNGWVLDDYLSADPPTRSVMTGIGPDVG